MELFIGYLNIPVRNRGADRYDTYVLGRGVVACVHVLMMGEGGTFCYFDAYAARRVKNWIFETQKVF